MNTAQQIAVARFLMTRAALAPASEAPSLMAKSRRHFLIARRPELDGILHPRLLDHPRGVRLIDSMQ